MPTTKSIPVAKGEVNWHESMTQTFEFYTVDPNTWKDDKPITFIESCSIERDESNETLGSARFDVGEHLDECYIRTYLVVIQNGFTNKFPLGTHLVQTTPKEFDGLKTKYEVDAYTPLLELKESQPPIGYSILKETKIMPLAANICREVMRAPIVSGKSEEKLYSDFVANLNDTWLTFLKDLVANAKHEIALDEMGQVIFKPTQDIASLQPVMVFNDDNSSILYPSVKDDNDIYGIPNVVEVIYSTNAGFLRSRVVNDDPNSPISTVNRGREIVHRESSPQINGTPTQEYIDAYALQLLRNLSCLVHKITFEHSYYPVRVGDAVILNYERAGLKNIKAKITAQSIKCETGCSIQETAVYTTKLWR